MGGMGTGFTPEEKADYEEKKFDANEAKKNCTFDFSHGLLI